MIHINSFSEFLNESDSTAENVEILYKPEGKIGEYDKKHPGVEEMIDLWGSQGFQGPYGPQGAWIYLDDSKVELDKNVENFDLISFELYVTIMIMGRINDHVSSCKKFLNKDGSYEFKILTRFADDIIAYIQTFNDIVFVKAKQDELTVLKLYYTKYVKDTKDHPLRGSTHGKSFNI